MAKALSSPQKCFTDDGMQNMMLIRRNKSFPHSQRNINPNFFLLFTTDTGDDNAAITLLLEGCGESTKVFQLHN